MPYLGIFQLASWKTIVTLEISTLKYVNFQNFVKKTKFSLFDTKNALFGYFCARILRKYCHISSRHTQICLIAKCCEKTKRPKFGTKSALFGYFCPRNFKNYCNILNQHHQICLIAKFCEKTKLPKFGILNGLRYFWGLISKGPYHIWNQHAKICLIRKFPKKLKLFTFGKQNFWFRIFGLEFLKTILIFQVSILKFVKL